MRTSKALDGCPSPRAPIPKQEASARCVHRPGKLQARSGANQSESRAGAYSCKTGSLGYDAARLGRLRSAHLQWPPPATVRAPFARGRRFKRAAKARLCADHCGSWAWPWRLRLTPTAFQRGSLRCPSNLGQPSPACTCFLRQVSPTAPHPQLSGCNASPTSPRRSHAMSSCKNCPI